MDVRDKNVFVGLSGGVDSAVSAALLLRGGARVTGVFIKGWYPPGMPCTWAQDRRDAMRVAAKLRIPFLTLDASQEYKESVIDYLLAEYRAGRTPNPDVMCNRDIKFGAFYRYAKARGADAIATGHYRSGEKDQSYFLWAVPREALGASVFPVGERGKPGVRALAKKLGLPVADKKDSQGVCFLGSISIEEFLRAELGAVPGVAKDESGAVVGTHSGAALSTVGERVALAGASAPGPWFVRGKDVEANELRVAKEQAGPRSEAVLFSSPNWLGDPAEVSEAEYRYRGPRIKGRVEGDRFVPAEALREAPAPGQSLVFYAGNRLAGGGIIEG